MSFSWRYPWGHRAHQTLLAELLTVRYLYVDPEVIVQAELKRRAAQEDKQNGE